MKVSYNWLKELVDFDWSPEELANKLTMSGSEVETIKPLIKELDEIIVGKIEKIEKHPSLGKLSVCSVNISSKNLQIVCGAPNVEVGQTIPVALTGACLSDGTKIETGEVKGVKSEGMLCSEGELGFSEEKEGIMILENDLKIGAPLSKALNLDDWVLDIDLTPNRADCLSMVGIAREVSALTGNSIKRPQIKVSESSEPASEYIKIEIEDTSACPRYTARIIKGVKIAPSPFWLKRRLLSVGMRPINNVVDVTNLVMMELGHPLHAFDYNLFSEKKVLVRKAKSNERFITLDGVERKLDEQMLLITDGKRGVAIAGIMGGVESEVTSFTKDILLESAYFDPRVIRRGRVKLGISTESSHRFERDTDPNITEMAIDRAVQLINRLAGGEILEGAIDNYPKPILPLRVNLRPERANQLLNISLSSQEMTKILEDLEMNVQEKDGLLEVEVPTFRPDLTREIDLIEEIARIYGYDGIELSSKTGGSLLNDISAEEKIQRKVKNLLVGKGFFEIYTNNLVDPELLQKVNPQTEMLSLQNPLSEELSVLTTTLAYGMLSVVAHNKNHKQKDLRLFELNKVVLPKKKDELPEERYNLCLALSGKRKPMQWGEDYKKEVDIFDLKGAIEEIFESLGVFNLRLSSQKKNLFEANSSLAISIDGKTIGSCGEVSKKISAEFSIKDKIFLAEMDFNLLSQFVSFAQTFKPLPRFPDSKRDLAILIDQDISSEVIRKNIIESGVGLVAKVVLFDLYQGKQIPSGKKSLAYSISYRSLERTLTDEEVEKAHRNIITQLEKKYGAKLRK